MDPQTWTGKKPLMYLTIKPASMLLILFQPRKLFANLRTYNNVLIDKNIVIYLPNVEESEHKMVRSIFGPVRKKVLFYWAGNR